MNETNNRHKPHRYPKCRKNRDTSYSLTYYILKNIGKEALYEIWLLNGHRKTADIISNKLGIWVRYSVIQYICQKKFHFVRVVTDKNLPIYKGVLNGKMPAEFYKSISFQ